METVRDWITSKGTNCIFGRNVSQLLYTFQVFRKIWILLQAGFVAQNERREASLEKPDFISDFRSQSRDYLKSWKKIHFQKISRISAKAARVKLHK